MKIIRETIKTATNLPATIITRAANAINGRQNFIVTQNFSASPEAVFAQLSDPDCMSAWAGIKLARIRDGKEPSAPNGTGSLRSVKVGPTSFVEEITSYNPPEGYTYTISKGSPMKDYLGRVQITPRAGGCRAEWSVSFKSRIPLAGPVLVNATRAGFALGLKKLSKRMAGNQWPRCS